VQQKNTEIKVPSGFDGIQEKWIGRVNEIQIHLHGATCERNTPT